jgi:hypothetical protein
MEHYAFNTHETELPKDKLFREVTETFYEIFPDAEGRLPHSMDAVTEDGEKIRLIASIEKDDRVRLSLNAVTGDGSSLPSLFDRFLHKGIRIHKLICPDTDDEMRQHLTDYPKKHQLL